MRESKSSYYCGFYDSRAVYYLRTALSDRKDDNLESFGAAFTGC
jgi:hypothetical protein